MVALYPVDPTNQSYECVRELMGSGVNEGEAMASGIAMNGLGKLWQMSSDHRASLKIGNVGTPQRNNSLGIPSLNT